MKNKIIAKSLKEIRKSNALTVHDVVLKLGKKSINIADKTLYGWESGHAQPDITTLFALCEIYQIKDILGAFGYGQVELLNLTKDEERVIMSLREQPEMILAVHKLLGIECAHNG